MPTIRELAEQLWNGETTTTDWHPVHSRAEAAEEVADGVLVFKGIASANVVDSGAALLMLDTGAINEQRVLHAAVRGWRPHTPLAAAVWSHHHVDHVFGVGPFDAEAVAQGSARPRVYAHHLVPVHHARYQQTLGWNTAINIRQFELPPERFRWPAQFRDVDVPVGDAHTFALGELTVELRHHRGETEDAVWTWIPERRLLAPGDLFIWATPNAGNPQKVQRWAGEWAEALRAMAALGAELLLPGHGLPIFGADRIHQALTDTAEVLESIESQVLALMNLGHSLDYVLHAVQPPQHLLERPYLRPVYDDPQFLIRNIWRLYGGWWDGEFDSLLPAPRGEQAREWVSLAGGLLALLARAKDLFNEGNLRLACHLVETAVAAEPGSAEAHELRAEVYARRAGLQTSSMARNILMHAAHSSRRGLRDLAGETLRQ